MTVLARLMALALALSVPAVGRAASPTAATPAPSAEMPGDLIVPQGTGKLLHIDQPIGSVVVGDQRVADVKLVAPQMVYVFGVAIGRTDMTVLGEDDKVVASTSIGIAPDAPGSSTALKKSYPSSELDYEIVGNRLVLKGHAHTVEEATAAQRILSSAGDKDHASNEATYAGSQEITLKVRFTEVDRTQVSNLGFDWNSLFGVGSTALGLATGGAIGQAVGAAPALNLTPYATTSVGVKAGKINANLVIEALEQKGAVHSLAEPTLTVRSGSTAKFRAGGEIPVPVPQPGATGGGGLVTIEYHSFGVSLEFTPVLVGRNRIAIHVVPEVSDVSQQNAVTLNGATVPSFSVRHAETDVDLASGQTFAIAGLFQRNISNTHNAIPGVGDIPVLGELFQSRQYQRGETELVILITPYLVEPISEARAAQPNQGAETKLGRPATLPPTERVGFVVE